MSYSNSTTHYALPLPTGSDKSLFTDTNQAFQDIDAAIYTAETVSTSAATDITAIKATIVNLQNADITFQNDITSLKGRMTVVEGVASQNTTDIADVRSDAEDMITAHNEPTATSAHAYAIGDEFIYNDVLYRATAAIAIGDTIVPNTNCAATNVMTEVNQINSDLTVQVITVPNPTVDGNNRVYSIAGLMAHREFDITIGIQGYGVLDNRIVRGETSYYVYATDDAYTWSGLVIVRNDKIEVRTLANNSTPDSTYLKLQALNVIG